MNEEVSFEFLTFDEIDIPEQITIEKIIADVSNEKLNEVAEKLKTLPREKLIQSTQDYFLRKKRISFWLVNCECSRRGIPPIFRNLPTADEDEPLQIADLLWIDLEWLHTKYAGHTPFYRRWKCIFKGKTFPHRTAFLIFNELKLQQIWKTTKGLALPEEWQKELHFIKLDRIYNQIRLLEQLKITVLNDLRQAHYRRGLKILTDAEKATIQRRLDIWFCGCLSNGKPQRTANLYESLTGTKISRQLALNLINDVKRDIPKAFAKR